MQNEQKKQIVDLVDLRLCQTCRFNKEAHTTKNGEEVIMVFCTRKWCDNHIYTSAKPCRIEYEVK